MLIGRNTSKKVYGALMMISSDRHSRLYVITHIIGAITLMLFGIALLTDKGV